MVLLMYIYTFIKIIVLLEKTITYKTKIIYEDLSSVCTCSCLLIINKLKTNIYLEYI